MQTIISDALAYLKAGKQVDVKIAIDGLYASTIIYSSELVAGTVTLDRNSVSSDTIEIGNAETSEFSFLLKNEKHQWDTFKFEGAVLTVDFIIGSEILRAGKFIVDKTEKTQHAIKVVALDYMAKFNKYFNLAYSGDTTLGEMLAYCCTACEVTQHTLSFPNDSSATVWPSDDEITYHELVGYIAQLAGGNAWVDWNGELRLSWYGQNQGDSEIELTAADRFSYDLAENDIRITGVACIIDDTEYVAGTDIYALVIENNPLVVADTVGTLLNSILTVIGSFTYRPFAFTSKFYPHIWPLDMVKITDNSGYVFTSIVTNSNLVMNRSAVLSGKGKSSAVVSYASAAPFTSAQKAVLERVIDLRAGQQITALDQAMIQLNSLAANAQGFYSTSVAQGDGSRIDYLHDQPVLDDSSIVYMQSIDGFFWTEDYQGASTVWTSGYTASGNIVAKQLDVIGINADWIGVGLITGTKLADGSISDVKVATGLSASKITTGSLISSNHSGVGDGSGFSTAGTKINMADGTISAPKFRIASDGSAVFAGSVTGGTMNINNRFTVNSSGDLYCASIDIGSDGLYVEGDVTFDDTLYQKAYIRPTEANNSNCGANGNRWNEVWAKNGAIQTSDRRLKTNIQQIQHGVDFVLSLIPVQFEMIDARSGRPHHGFIAQEVKDVMDRIGMDFAGYIDPTINPTEDDLKNADRTALSFNMLSLRYEEFIASIVQTIQYLNNRVNDLEARLAQG